MAAKSCIITILAIECEAIFREKNFPFLSTSSLGDCSKNSLISSLYWTHIMNDEIIKQLKNQQQKSTKTPIK